MPALVRIHHFSPTVTDVEASAAWYQEVFGFERLPVTFPHYEKEDTGYAVLLMDPASGVTVGLHHNEANGGGRFDEKDTGLDHVAFEVADVAGLEEWVDKLDRLGVSHSGIRSVSDPVPFSTVVFRDPDNIQLELIVM